MSVEIVYFKNTWGIQHENGPSMGNFSLLLISFGLWQFIKKESLFILFYLKFYLNLRELVNS